MLVYKLSLKVSPTKSSVQMASTYFSTSVIGVCFVDITIHHSNYSNVRLHIMDNLCADIILGIDFQSQQQTVILNFGGLREPLVVEIALLSVANLQVPIKREDRLYTAFEADGGLHQFTCMPFGVTNREAQFQRTMDDFIANEKLKDTFAYLDNLTICGMTQEEHGFNLYHFLLAAKMKNLTYKNEKCNFSTTSLYLFGYEVSHQQIKPDTEQLRPL